MTDLTRHTPRLLPWTTDTGKPCLLSTDDSGGFLSRVADTLEAAQVDVAERVLGEAEKTLTNPLSTRAEVEYAGVRLSGCLADVLRVAESRRQRLPAVEDHGSDGAESETRGADA
ncbi:hypothetical protein ACWGH5_07060 [Streptomyces sp. NPDC054864]